MKIALVLAVCMVSSIHGMELPLAAVEKIVPDEKTVQIPRGNPSLDKYAYEFVLDNPDTRIALIWPRARDKAEGIKAILAQCGPLLYEKKFALFRCGPTHIFLVAHPQWAEDVALSMCHYIPADMKQPYIFCAVLFQTSKSLDEIRQVKKLIREYAGISYWSIHIDDNHEDACTLARAVFKDNPEQLLYKLTTKWRSWWKKKKISKFRHTIRKYKQFGGDLNDKDDSGYTLLCGYTAWIPELVPFLLEEGADPNIQGFNRRAQPPLWIAAGDNSLQALDQLIAYGAEVDKPSTDGTSPLCKAALCGSAESVKRLIKAGAHVHKKIHGQSILFHLLGPNARNECKLETLEELLAGGADVNEKNECGFNALMTAAPFCPLPIFARVLKETTDINAQNGNKETALYIATKNCDAEKVSLLIKAGADPNSAPEDSTPLLLACCYSHDIAKMLIAAGADIMVERSSYVPLTCAAGYAQPEIVRDLLKIHPHKVPQKNYLYKALCICVSVAKEKDEKVAEIVSTLLDAGALDEKNDNDTPTQGIVCIAAINGYCKALQLLVKAGFSPNYLDHRGRTPILHLINARINRWYAHSNHGKPREVLNEAEAIKALIEAGADVTIKDPLGGTALGIARVYKFDDLISILKQTKASSKSAKAAILP